MRLKKVLKCIIEIFGFCIGLGFVVSKAEMRRGKKGWVDGHKAGFYERNVKRAFDFGLSLFALIILSPVMPIISILVRLKLGSSIFFRQERSGLGGSTFTIKKFRTMNDRRDFNGELLSDEQRMPYFGEVLRKTSIDELPELFNIIAGDMSIIGPRPLPLRYISYFTEQEKHRHDVRPGLTGLAQINGRNDISWDRKFELDVEYCENITFFRDLRILLNTVGKVLRGEGIVVRGTGNSVLDLDVERSLRWRKGDEK